MLVSAVILLVVAVCVAYGYFAVMLLDWLDERFVTLWLQRRLDRRLAEIRARKPLP